MAKEVQFNKECPNCDCKMADTNVFCCYRCYQVYIEGKNGI